MKQELFFNRLHVKNDRSPKICWQIKKEVLLYGGGVQTGMRSETKRKLMYRTGEILLTVNR